MGKSLSGHVLKIMALHMSYVLCPMSNLTSNQHWIMHYAHCTALCMLSQPTWFMFAMLGGIPEWCIPLILTWDCEIGKTGLAGMHASLGRALLKPEIRDFPRSKYFHLCTPGRHKYWFTRIIWGITHYPGLHSSSDIRWAHRRGQQQLPRGSISLFCL